MKLSEALRLGEFALLPEHGSWYAFNHQGEVYSGCAVGRACFAAGFLPCKQNNEIEQLDIFMRRTWPWVNDYHGTLSEPAQTKYWTRSAFTNDVLTSMSNYYETFGWSLSQIADWVSTIEPQDVVQPEPVAMYMGVMRG